MSQNNNALYKIVLLGESSVGKTSIITRLTKNTFSQLSISTFSGCYTQKELDIDGTIINLEIWDTAGQERYRSLAKNYYKGCDAAIFVYDITNKKTFDEISNYWLNELRDNCPDIILGLAGNKFDLFEKEQVTEKEGKILAEKIDAVFYSTSAKESVGIDALFQDIGEMLVQKNNRTESIFNNTISTKLSAENMTSGKKCC